MLTDMNIISETLLTFFSWLGMMQRTKFGLVLLSVCMRRVNCSLYVCPTVRNIPLRVDRPPKAADASLAETVAPIPTISANNITVYRS